MKNAFKLWLSVIVMIFPLAGWGQGFVENALLFSRTKPGGSARIQAMGGAQIALGGDFSSALSNPAGLGMFNRTEITFSPAFNTYQTTSNHLGKKESDSKGLLNIPGLSVVYHAPQEKGKFLGGSFAISMTRVNDFNNTFRYSNTDFGSSIIDYFIENANASDFSDIRTELGYNTFLLEDSSYYGGNPNQYFSVMGLDPDDPEDIRSVQRAGSVITKGAQYQWSFGYGGNFNDKLFVGANIGITSFRYKFNSTYREWDYVFASRSGALNSLEMSESITIDGSGINLTLGMIYRPISFVQLGLSLVTPTLYELSDTYHVSLDTYWNGYDYLNVGPLYNEGSELSEPLISEYSLTTPLKLSLGGAFFISKIGLITGDVEFINYGKAKYRSEVTGISFADENKGVNTYYTNTVNYRFGTEWRINVFRLRAGYSLQGNPYKRQYEVDQKIQTVSAGVGVRFNKYSVDAAWLRSEGKSAYSPYVFLDNTGPVANLKNNITSVMVTVGYRF
jgi:hypothetical protein